MYVDDTCGGTFQCCPPLVDCVSHHILQTGYSKSTALPTYRSGPLSLTTITAGHSSRGSDFTIFHASIPRAFRNDSSHTRMNAVKSHCTDGLEQQHCARSATTARAQKPRSPSVWSGKRARQIPSLRFLSARPVYARLSERRSSASLASCLGFSQRRGRLLTGPGSTPTGGLPRLLSFRNDRRELSSTRLGGKYRTPEISRIP